MFRFLLWLCFDIKIQSPIVLNARPNVSTLGLYSAFIRDDLIFQRWSLDTRGMMLFANDV